MGRMEESRREFNPERDEQRPYETQNFEEREYGGARRPDPRESRDERMRHGRDWDEQEEYGRFRPQRSSYGEPGPREGSQAWQYGQGSRQGQGPQYGQGSQYGQGWQGRERPDYPQQREFYGQGEASYSSGRGGESYGRPYGYRGYSPTGDTSRWSGGSRWTGEDLDDYRTYGGGARQYGGPADRTGWTTDYGPSRPFTDARYGRYGEQSYGRFMGHESGNYGPFEGRYGGGREDEDRGPGFGEQMREFGGAMAQRMRRMFRSPKGYKRSDERIREDVCDQLAQSHVDPSDIEVHVSDGEVTLTGTVSERYMKWQIEQVIDNIGGVNEIHNQLRVRRMDQPANTNTSNQGSNVGGSLSGTGRSQARS